MSTPITKSATGDADRTNRVASGVGTDSVNLVEIDGSRITSVLRIGSFDDTKVFELKLNSETDDTILREAILPFIDAGTCANISKVKTENYINIYTDAPTLEQNDKYGFLSEFLVTMADYTKKKFKMFLPYASQGATSEADWEQFVTGGLVGNGLNPVAGVVWADGNNQLYFPGMLAHNTIIAVEHLQTSKTRMR